MRLLITLLGLLISEPAKLYFKIQGYMGVTISILELRVNETTMQKNLSRLLKKF